jgi:histidinol-phosphatase (PHP family)
MAAEYSPKFIIGCDAHTPKLIRQPEHIKGFTDFLERNGVDVGDNIVDIVEV